MEETGQISRNNEIQIQVFISLCYRQAKQNVFMWRFLLEFLQVLYLLKSCEEIAEVENG